MPELYTSEVNGGDNMLNPSLVPRHLPRIYLAAAEKNRFSTTAVRENLGGGLGTRLVDTLASFPGRVGGEKDSLLPRGLGMRLVDTPTKKKNLHGN